MGYVLRRVALKLYNYYAKVFAVNYLSTTLEGAVLCAYRRFFTNGCCVL